MAIGGKGIFGMPTTISNDITLGAGKHLVLPLHNDAVTPTLILDGDNSGFYASADNDLRVAIAGAAKWEFSATYFGAISANAPVLLNETTSSTNPTVVPRRGDTDSGIGLAALDQLSFIAGGVEGIRITENASKIDEIKLNGPRVDNLYTWIEDFDDEVAGVEFESALNADFWTTAGTNYASSNVTYTGDPGGSIDAKCAAAEDDSVTIIGTGNIRIDSNPIMEARFKIDVKETACCFVGFAEGSFVDKGTPDDDIFLVGIDSDNGHSFGATQIVALSNDNNGGADYDDMGVAIVNNTYIKVKIDLTDTEQPRVWINDTEVIAGNITGTVQAAITVAPYIHVQNLAGGAIQRTITVDYIKVWQDRG